MSEEKEKEKDFEKEIFGGLKGKQAPWLRAFLNETNDITFRNKTESAIAAKYNCKDRNTFCVVGCQNFVKLRKRISYWLDKNGLSDNALEMKLVSLMDVHETKIINVSGKIKEGSLPENCMIIAEASTEKASKSGQMYTEYTTVIGVNMDANHIQLKSLELAFKAKGKLTDKIEITNLSDLGKRLNDAHKRTE